jgi:hypothetical protein
MTALRERIKRFNANSQQGTAIIMALLILLVLSVIGVYAVTTSTVETKITGVEQGFQEAFYTADAGEPIGTYVTKQILHYDPQTASALGAPWSSVVNEATLITSGKLFSNTTRNLSEPLPGAADINASLTSSQALGLPGYVQLSVDIDRLNSQLMPGGGVEFASGYEGVGQGGGGAVGVLYGVDSVGRYGLRGADSRVFVGYRYVPGVAGGE